MPCTTCGHKSNNSSKHLEVWNQYLVLQHNPQEKQEAPKKKKHTQRQKPLVCMSCRK